MVRKRGPSSCLSPEQIEWAYYQWCNGYTLREIAEVLNAAESTVYKSFKGRRKRHPPLKPPGNRTGKGQAKHE